MLDDDKAPRAAVLEILQDAVRGQNPAQETGNGAEILSVYCGKTKVFLANSMVSAVPWLMALECSCLRAILPQMVEAKLPSQRAKIGHFPSNCLTQSSTHQHPALQGTLRRGLCVGQGAALELSEFQ